MVLDHWSNDAMVSMDRCGLLNSNAILTALDIFFRFEEIGCSVEHWQIQITTDDEMRRLIQCVHCDLAGSNLTRPPDYKCFNVKE